MDDAPVLVPDLVGDEGDGLAWIVVQEVLQTARPATNRGLVDAVGTAVATPDARRNREACNKFVLNHGDRLRLLALSAFFYPRQSRFRNRCALSQLANGSADSSFFRWPVGGDEPTAAHASRAVMPICHPGSPYRRPAFFMRARPRLLPKLGLELVGELVGPGVGEERGGALPLVDELADDAGESERNGPRSGRER
jgi:hypothetical protein